MKYGISFLVSLFLLAACETTNVYPTEVVEVPKAETAVSCSAVDPTQIEIKLDCASVGAFQHGDSCISNCTLCSSQEICIDTDGDKWKDTCVQGETPLEPPPAHEPTATTEAPPAREPPVEVQCGGTFGMIGTPCSGAFGACAENGVLECADGEWECSTDVKGSESLATVELCDGKDNDCDGETDEDYTSDLGKQCFGLNQCGLGPGVVVCNKKGEIAQLSCTVGTPSTAYATLDSPELCDDIDNNCDGKIDEGCALKVDPSEEDNDKDSYMALNDCDDNDALIHPGLDNCPTFQGLTKDSYKLVLVWGGAENSPYTANAYFKFGKSAVELQFSSKVFFDNTWEVKSFPQYNYTATDLEKQSSHVAFNVFGYPGYWYLCSGNVVDTISFALSKELPKVYLISGGVWKEVGSKLEVLAANDLEVVKGPIYGGDYNKSKPAYCAAMLQL